MYANVVLASFAKVSDNMLDVQAGGWSFIGPGVVQFFVAGVLHCPWHESNQKQKHAFSIELLDADGAAVENPEKGEPAKVDGEFEIGRPPGTKPGTSVPAPFAFPFGGWELDAGEQYEIRLTIDGETQEGWRLPFTVRERPPDVLAA